MRKILVCQHVAYELLGTLNPLLKESGFRIKYVNFGRSPEARPSLDDYDGLVVLGGPMNCDEVEKYPNLSHEVRLIQEAIVKKKPVLGICLGAQLMARALGAPVKPNPQKEIGWYPLSLTNEGEKDPLLRHLKELKNVFQWHGDTFDVPKGAVPLASSPLCAHQAFKYGDKAYALQFHLEVDQAMIERWFAVENNQAELEFLKDEISPQKIKEETKHSIDPLIEKGKLVFKEWTKLFGEEKKKRILPSR